MPERNYIVVEGPPGAGKSLLLDYLAKKRKAKKVVDNNEANEFLGKFQAKPRQYALSTQISFLLTRHQMLREITQYNLFRDVMIADFLYERNFIYANILLTESELALFNQLAQHFRGELPHPDLVVYLQASPEFIRRSGWSLSNDDVLKSLCDAYNHFFFHYDKAPVLVVRPDQLDLKNEFDLTELDNFISREIRNTVYFLKKGELF